MSKIRPLIFIAVIITLFSCEKEYSDENLNKGGNESIIGNDCRISKIVYADTTGLAASGRVVGLGSITADINNLDILTKLVKFDSLSNFIDYNCDPVYSNDSIFIDPEEYFITDANKRIIKSHLWVDITDPSSLQFDVIYTYDPAGYLTSKSYLLTGTGTPFQRVDYTYTFPGNLTRMTAVELPSGDLAMDADITYYTNINLNRFIYLFPDERFYPEFTQFLNFGNRNKNAPKLLKVRNFDPGNVVRDSLVSAFSNYKTSLDGYVLSVQMGNPQPEATPPLTPSPQPSIPALPGRLSFSYHCK